jgi:RHS repeat-associated protein
VTWVYRPGTFTPLTQSERLSASEDPQQVIDQGFYAIIADQLGTPAELVSATGAAAGHQQHTLWGGTLWHPGGASTPLRFPGQYHDPETGLHYNQQRYYDPVAGSYLTPDPLGLAPAPNPHAYVPNPHLHADPLSLMACGPEGTTPGDRGAGTAQLFRTVGSDEAFDIAKSGVYRNPIGLEGKYFYPTRAQTESLAAKYAKLGLGDQTLTSSLHLSVLARKSRSAPSSIPRTDQHWCPARRG